MKPKRYTQLHIQIIFAVRNRKALLTDEIREQVFAYMAGILSEMDHKALIVNGTSTHVHILLGLNPAKSISETVLQLKRSTSIHINQNKLCLWKFAWQGGYSAFAYSKSQVDKVYKYIENQEEHHKQKSFREEYLKCLQNLDIEYDERYMFDFMDDV